MPSIADILQRNLSEVWTFSNTDPGAGQEASWVVPAGENWELLSLHLVLVTSAVVANRVPNIVIDNSGAAIYTKLAAGTTQPASISADYSFSVDLPLSTGALAAGGVSTGSMPRMVIPAGSRIRTLTTALDAGDNYGLSTLYYRKF